jgi:hypothetical protein
MCIWVLVFLYCLIFISYGFLTSILKFYSASLFLHIPRSATYLPLYRSLIPHFIWGKRQGVLITLTYNTFQNGVYNLGIPVYSASKTSCIQCEISSSHGGEYDVQNCLLGCTAVYDGGSTYLWNIVRQLFYTAVHPRKKFWISCIQLLV